MVFINNFGLPQAISRSQVPATKELDLSGLEGQQKIKMDMKHLLVKFEKTFQKIVCKNTVCTI